jgi:oligosaccharyltransferase complex subunit alpha (ribophorin I)
LETPFSRIDYQIHINAFRSVPPSAIESIPITLPKNVYNVYYRDLVGNVSTSTLNGPSLILKPRFPLFGGWKFTWNHGYSVPLDGWIHEVGSKHVLSVSLFDSMKNTAVTELKVDIVLPEGAKNIKVHLPFKLAQLPLLDVSFSYLDTIGRPTIHLEAHDVLIDYSQKVQVEYEYPQWEWIRKPLVVFGIVFSLFALVIIVKRLDWSIVSPTKMKTE